MDKKLFLLVIICVTNLHANDSNQTGIMYHAKRMVGNLCGVPEELAPKSTFSAMVSFKRGNAEPLLVALTNNNVNPETIEKSFKYKSFYFHPFRSVSDEAKYAYLERFPSDQGRSAAGFPPWFFFKDFQFLLDNGFINLNRFSSSSDGTLLDSFIDAHNRNDICIQTSFRDNAILFKLEAPHSMKDIVFLCIMNGAERSPFNRSHVRFLKERLEDHNSTNIIDPVDSAVSDLKNAIGREIAFKALILCQNRTPNATNANKLPKELQKLVGDYLGVEKFGNPAFPIMHQLLNDSFIRYLKHLREDDEAHQTNYFQINLEGIQRPEERISPRLTIQEFASICLLEKPYFTGSHRKFLENKLTSECYQPVEHTLGALKSLKRKMLMDRRVCLALTLCKKGFPNDVGSIILEFSELNLVNTTPNSRLNNWMSLFDAHYLDPLRVSDLNKSVYHSVWNSSDSNNGLLSAFCKWLQRDKNRNKGLEAIIREFLPERSSIKPEPHRLVLQELNKTDRTFLNLRNLH